jgi:hypothetical protein
VPLLLLFFVTGFFVDHRVHGQCIIVLLDAEGDGVALRGTAWRDVAATTASRRRGLTTTKFEGTKDAAHYIDLDEKPVRDVVPQVLLLTT